MGILQYYYDNMTKNELGDQVVDPSQVFPVYYSSSRTYYTCRCKVCPQMHRNKCRNHFRPYYQKNGRIRVGIIRWNVIQLLKISRSFIYLSSFGDLPINFKQPVKFGQRYCYRVTIINNLRIRISSNLDTIQQNYYIEVVIVSGFCQLQLNISGVFGGCFVLNI